MNIFIDLVVMSQISLDEYMIVYMYEYKSII